MNLSPKTIKGNRIKSKKFFFLKGLFTLSFLLLFTLVSLPAYSQVLSINNESERKIGEKADKDIIKHFGLLKNKNLQKYVSDVGQRLIKQIDDPIFEYYFKVLDHPMVNAFALPGGYIYITRGMLVYINSEAELATILGHEIGHVTSHHAMKQMQKSLGSTLLTLAGLIASKDVRNEAGAWIAATSTLTQHILSGYGREAEMESDQLGIVYSYYAGYDPRVVSDFFRKLKAMERFGGHKYHGFLASHPDTIDRVVSAEGQAESIVGRGKKLFLKKNEFLKMINGIPYGEPEGLKSKRTDFLIKIYKVTSDDTIKNIVSLVAGSPETALEVALLNGKKMNSIMKRGDSLKVILPSNSIKSKKK